MEVVTEPPADLFEDSLLLRCIDDDLNWFTNIASRDTPIESESDHSEEDSDDERDTKRKNRDDVAYSPQRLICKRKKSKPRMYTWTEQQTSLLISAVKSFSDKPIHWPTIATKVPGKTGHQCHERWYRVSNPEINKGPFLPEEYSAILSLYTGIGPKWSEIANFLPGRVDIRVKYEWNKQKKSLTKPWKSTENLILLKCVNLVKNKTGEERWVKIAEELNNHEYYRCQKITRTSLDCKTKYNDIVSNPRNKISSK